MFCLFNFIFYFHAWQRLLHQTKICIIAMLHQPFIFSNYNLKFIHLRVTILYCMDYNTYAKDKNRIEYNYDTNNRYVI